MSDRDALVTRLKQLLRDPSAVSGGDSFAWTPAELITNLEEARQEIQTKLAVRVPEKIGSTTTTTYAEGLASIALPASPNLAFAAIATVRTRPVSSSSESDYRVLVGVNLTQLQGMRFSSGWPTHYALQGGNIWLGMRPDEGQTLSFCYVPELAVLAGGAAIPTELPARFHHLIAYEAAVGIQEQAGAPSPLAFRRDTLMESCLEFFHNITPDSGLDGSI